MNGTSEYEMFDSLLVELDVRYKGCQTPLNTFAIVSIGLISGNGY